LAGGIQKPPDPAPRIPATSHAGSTSSVGPTPACPARRTAAARSSTSASTRRRVRVAGLVDVGVTERVKRLGEYSTHEFGIQPEAYEPQPEVEFT
jgi:hypothetical protein